MYQLIDHPLPGARIADCTHTLSQPADNVPDSSEMRGSQACPRGVRGRIQDYLLLPSTLSWTQPELVRTPPQPGTTASFNSI